MMICTCTAKGQAEAETARLALALHLGVEAGGLAAALWASLHTHFKAEVRVGADQWFSVGVRVARTVEADPSEVIYQECVECDHPLDGMVHLWGKLTEQFPDRAPVHAGRVDADLNALSQQQIQAVASAEDAWDTHRTTCQEEDCVRADRIACTVGRPLWKRTWDVAEILLAKWGEPLPENKAAFWGEEPEAGDTQANELPTPDETP